mmetsp:Transcript_63590/g.160497  ORF Transcript_63590/g.160497 Transcript_63590/m.160497 type:complete len:225 (+) Transcript_63590:338-1012(+)
MQRGRGSGWRHPGTPLAARTAARGAWCKCDWCRASLFFPPGSTARVLASGLCASSRRLLVAWRGCDWHHCGMPFAPSCTTRVHAHTRRISSRRILRTGGHPCACVTTSNPNVCRYWTQITSCQVLLPESHKEGNTAFQTRIRMAVECAGEECGELACILGKLKSVEKQRRGVVQDGRSSGVVCMHRETAFLLQKLCPRVIHAMPAIVQTADLGTDLLEFCKPLD